MVFVDCHVELPQRLMLKPPFLMLIFHVLVPTLMIVSPLLKA